MSGTAISSRSHIEVEPAKPAHRRNASPFSVTSARRDASPPASIRASRESSATPQATASGSPSRREGARTSPLNTSDKEKSPYAEDCGADLYLPAIVRSDPQNEPGDDDGDDQTFGRRFAGEITAAVLESPLDATSLMDELAPLAGDSGIFEILLPGGGTLGVVVNVQPAMVSFLLNPPTAKFGQRLRGQKMELEARLERRIGRNVRLTVL